MTPPSDKSLEELAVKYVKRLFALEQILYPDDSQIAEAMLYAGEHFKKGFVAGFKAARENTIAEVLGLLRGYNCRDIYLLDHELAPVGAGRPSYRFANIIESKMTKKGDGG